MDLEPASHADVHASMGRRLFLVPALVLGIGACVPSGQTVGRSALGGQLALAAEARVVRGTLEANLRLTNTTDRALSIGFGACSARILGWKTPHREGPPAFTSAVPRGPTGYGRLCPLYLAIRELAPGETLTSRDARELYESVGVAEVLSDSLLDGRYWLSVMFDLAEIDRQRGGLTLRADLGPLDLAADRPPITTRALRYGARFEADSVRIEGDHLRAVVRVRPVPAMGSDVVAFRPCAVRVLAYADPARRDAAPRSGAPDATTDAACGQAPPTALGPRRRSAALPPFYVAPETPLRAEVNLALADVLSGRPAGQYALAVVVLTLGPPGEAPGPLPPVYLSLGEVDWQP